MRAVAANGGAAEDFYSWLYVGLYREPKGDDAGSPEELAAAARLVLLNDDRHYMAAPRRCTLSEAVVVTFD